MYTAYAVTFEQRLVVQLRYIKRPCTPNLEAPWPPFCLDQSLEARSQLASQLYLTRQTQYPPKVAAITYMCCFTDENKTTKIVFRAHNKNLTSRKLPAIRQPIIFEGEKFREFPKFLQLHEKKVVVILQHLARSLRLYSKPTTAVIHENSFRESAKFTTTANRDIFAPRKLLAREKWQNQRIEKPTQLAPLIKCVCVRDLFRKSRILLRVKFALATRIRYTCEHNSSSHWLSCQLTIIIA